MDLIRKLGSLALASRVKRLAEWLYKDGARVYRELSVDFEPRWFTLFYLLKESGSVSVTEAAQTLGFSHPAIIQIAQEMSQRGFLESIKDRKDERKHILRLTEKGKATLSYLEVVWSDIETAAKELLKEAGGDFMTTIGRIEDALQKNGIYERVIRRTKDRQLDQIKIIDYQPQLKPYFKSLNYQWLREYFAIEKEDEQLLSDPYGEIIKPGGFVLFARLDGKIVGTVALVKHDKEIYELTKMAVEKKARGRQVGRKLALSVIERTKKIGAKKLVLLTSPQLAAANNLYHSIGFVKLSLKQPWAIAYRRGGAPMGLDLRKNKIK